MKKNILKRVKKEIDKFLQSQLKVKKKNKDWITPEDKRYTKILDTYEKKLSKLWQSQKKDYLKRFKKKELINVDENPEDYTDPQYDSTNYIDDALEILAEAFGLGVLVGFKEIENRGITVEIPENPNAYFDTAKEIKNYSWAALSYEQQQMDNVFQLYNKTENGKLFIDKWFDNNEYRLTDLMLSGLVWYGINFGFTRALVEASGQEDILAYWLTEADKKVCKDCKELEKGNPYSKDNPLPTLPGGGKTICGSSCRCIIDTKDRE